MLPTTILPSARLAMIAPSARHDLANVPEFRRTIFAAADLSGAERSGVDENSAAANANSSDVHLTRPLYLFAIVRYSLDSVASGFPEPFSKPFPKPWRLMEAPDVA